MSASIHPPQPYPVPATHRAALARLFAIARTDWPEGRTVSAFLLAWWHADLFGAFDLMRVADLPSLARDMALVYELATTGYGTPARLGIVGELEAIAQRRIGGGL